MLYSVRISRRGERKNEWCAKQKRNEKDLVRLRVNHYKTRTYACREGDREKWQKMTISSERKNLKNELPNNERANKRRGKWRRCLPQCRQSISQYFTTFSSYLRIQYISWNPTSPTISAETTSSNMSTQAINQSIWYLDKSRDFLVVFGTLGLIHSDQTSLNFEIYETESLQRMT